jgi:hypothetical protein
MIGLQKPIPHLGKCVFPEDNLSSITSNIGGNSLSSWNISSLSTSASRTRQDRLQWRDQKLSLPSLDSFAQSERPLLQGLYKSIPMERVEDLLDSGYDEVEALEKAVYDYVKNLPTMEEILQPNSEQDKNLIINDNSGFNSVLDYANLKNNTATINANAQDDTIYLGGDKNNVTLNLISGSNTINIDTSGSSTFVINSGTGSDQITLSADFKDYRFTDNSDGTYTIRDINSGTTVQVDNLVGGLNFADGTTMEIVAGTLTVNTTTEKQKIYIETDNTTYSMPVTGTNSYYEISGNNNTIDITATSGNETINLTGSGNTLNASMDAGNDIVSISGSNNIVNIDSVEKNDRVYVYAGNNNIINIQAGNYTDTVILEGTALDWNFDGIDTYTHATSGTTVTVDSVENIKFAEIITDTPDTTSVIDLTAYMDQSVIVNAGNMDDTINLGGAGNDVTVYLESGNNTVNINDGSYNNFIIKGGEGTDIVNLSGSLGDYTFQNNNNGTYTLTNTNNFATMTLDSSIEKLVLADESVITFDGTTFNIKGSTLADTLNIKGSDNTYEINMFNGDDNVSIAGTNNTVTLYLHNDNDSVYVAAGENNNITIDGAHGTDIITLQGSSRDWTLQGAGAGMYYEHNETGTRVTLLTGIESVTFENGPIIFDQETTNSALDTTGYNNTHVHIDAGVGNDVIYVGGTGNETTVNLVDGYNRLYIDDTTASTYEITGGAGQDNIFLTGNYLDYTFTQNPDDTTTITNTISGATITYDKYFVETINFADVSYDTMTEDLTASGTYNDDVITVSGLTGENLTVNSYAGNDVINLGGTGNTTTVNLTSGYNTVNIDDSTQSDYVINGGTGTDVINLTGNISDYSVVDNGNGTVTITNNTSLATITLSPDSIEKIAAADGNITMPGAPILIEGTSGDDVIDATGYNGANIEVVAYEGNDTINLNGTGNTTEVHLIAGDNTVNIDDSTASNYTINGGSGEDSIYLTGNMANYNVSNNADGTVTLTNTLSSATITLSPSAVEHVYAFDGEMILAQPAITINGTPNEDTLEVVGYNNTTITVNPDASNDVINIQGTNNNVTVNLTEGTNTVNIDDTAMNTFVVNGGTDIDIVNLSGNMPDYTFTDNGNGTLTLNNTLSGATTTIDTSVDIINFADGASFEFDGTTLNFLDGYGNDTTMDLSGYNNTSIRFQGINGDDTVSFGGTGNDVLASFSSGTNIINIDDTTASNYSINGGSGLDTVFVTGNVADYSLVTNPDSSFTITNDLTGAVLTITGVERVNAADGDISLPKPPVVIEGTTGADALDTTSYSSTEVTVNAYAGNDTITVGGSNNTNIINLMDGTNSVYLQETSYNENYIYGGTGTDRVYFSDTYLNYTFANNGDGTYTITHNVSGTTTTVDNAVEYLVFTDTNNNASTFSYTGPYIAPDIVLYAGNQNDTFDLSGAGSDFRVYLQSGDNTVNVDTSVDTDVWVYGGTGTDTVNISGDISAFNFYDYGGGYVRIRHNTSGSDTYIYSGIENINFDGGVTLSYDGMLTTINDRGGNFASTFNLNGSTGVAMVVNIDRGNDTVNLGGSDNFVTVNLARGNNTVNINDSSWNDFIINGGLDTDTVNFSAGISNYRFNDNGDGTLTITRASSGATTTIDSSVNNVTFSDGSTLTYDGSTVTITGTAAANSLTIGGSDTTYSINTAGSGDSIYVEAGSNNTINLDGGAGTDTLTLEGYATDWNLAGSTYTHTASGTSVTISNVENIFFTL